MHDTARAYIAAQVTGQTWARVVEIGGRNINGAVRDLITHDRYLSIDLEDGPDVDVVGDCRRWFPPWPADLVVCCEVLEHTPDPRGVLRACVDYLAPGGRLLVTCAGPGRAPHSGHNGMPHLRDGEHYANIDPLELRLWLFANGLTDVEITENTQAADVYATGVRP